MIEAEVFDLETGLKKINADYSGEDGIIEIPSFVEGTTENVSISLDFSCCVRSASFSLIDVAGNGNFKDFNKGPLKGEKEKSFMYLDFCNFFFLLSIQRLRISVCGGCYF